MAPKKCSKSLIAVLLALTASLAQNGQAVASLEDSGTVHLNPTSLRKLMIDGNPSLITQLNQVQQAKDQVRISRNQLLPSINLGALLATSAGPTFALSSVAALVPFLLPSNWFNFKASRNLFDAQVISYKIVELNTFASIYSLYETVLADQFLKDVLTQQYDELRQIQALLEKQNNFIGTVKLQDLDNARAQTNLAEVAVSKTDELLKQEFASLRYALGLNLTQTLVVDSQTVPASAFEDQPLQGVIDQSVKLAPEGAQLQAMIDANQAAKWSATFGFINSGSISASGSLSGGIPQAVSFGKTAGTTQLNLGFGIFPQVKLAKDKVEQVKIALGQLKNLQTLTLESTINSITETRRQLNLAVLAEQEMDEVFKIQQLQFSLGTTTLETLLYTRNLVTTAATTRVNAQASLDALRITLNRAMLENEFAENNIQGCKALAPAKRTFGTVIQNVGNGIGDVFSGKHASKTLDEICHAGG